MHTKTEQKICLSSPRGTIEKKSCGQEKMQPSNSSDAKTRESIATVGTAIVSFPMTRHFHACVIGMRNFPLKQNPAEGTKLERVRVSAFVYALMLAYILDYSFTTSNILWLVLRDFPLTQESAGYNL